ncbi:MAG: hypothetical protein L6Q77_15645 [Bacteroidetes bacterium]|nr:hypothetical protein [Bacteroidota bacterium]
MQAFDGLESVLFSNKFTFITWPGFNGWEKRILRGDSSLHLLFVPYSVYLEDSLTENNLRINSWYKTIPLQELKEKNWIIHFDTSSCLPASKSKTVIILE